MIQTKVLPMDLEILQHHQILKILLPLMLATDQVKPLPHHRGKILLRLLHGQAIRVKAQLRAQGKLLPSLMRAKVLLPLDLPNRIQEMV
jgi:hypothetical protein